MRWSRRAAADKEIAAVATIAGRSTGFRGERMDLLDTAGIATTYGAGAVPQPHPGEGDVMAVTAKLVEAGAVLVAKLSMGALALNDVWFGGETMNPWLPEEGSSGSSAGPGAAKVVAAGLVGSAIGSETQGSIRESVDALRR